MTFDGVQYDSVYATTNSVITFGRPDGTYWTYPSTPSISLYSMDWVVYPQWRQDEHLIIQSSDGGFQVNISARPIWLQNTLTPTNIVITAAINVDGTVAMSYLVTGPTYDNQTRTGVRLNNGSIVTLAQYGVTQVQTAPTLTAAPVETTTSTSQSESQTSTVDTSTSTPSDTSTTTTDTSTSTVDTSTTVVDSSTGVVDSTTSQNTTSPSDATTSTDQVPQPPTPAPQEPVVVPRDPSIDEDIVEEPSPTEPELDNPEDTQEEESEIVDDESPTEETDTPVLPEPEPENQSESSDNSTVEDTVSEALADGVLTEDEKSNIADALIDAADGEAISAEDLEESGLTYEDLPPETPVEVRTDDNGNPVIIEAQVAAALVVLESPAALIGALFDDPGKALLAVANIGADMSAEEREESEKVVVAAVIAGQAAIGAAALAAQATTTTGGTSSSGSSGGGGASGETKGVRRRNP